MNLSPRKWQKRMERSKIWRATCWELPKTDEIHQARVYKCVCNQNMIYNKNRKCRHAIVNILKMKCSENILKAVGIGGSTA